MSTKFYIKDENGTYLSIDGVTRYTCLEGQALYAFLKTPEGRRRSFHVEIDEDGNKIGIEAEPKKRSACSEQREPDRYRNKLKAKLNITIISASTMVSIPGEDEIELGDTVADEDSDVEAEALHNVDLETMRSALMELTPEEYAIIYNLYLAKEPLTERQLSVKLGIPQQTVNYRRNAILRKLRKFF